MRGKIWRSKEWKATRNRLLKSHCELCRSKDRLHLAHRWNNPTAVFVSKLVWSFLGASARLAKPPCWPVPPGCERCGCEVEDTQGNPRWHCVACHHTSDEAKVILRGDGEYGRKEWRGAFQDRYRIDVEWIVGEFIEDLQELYISGHLTVTLCVVCHARLSKGLSLPCQFCWPNPPKMRAAHERACLRCTKAFDEKLLATAINSTLKPYETMFKSCEAWVESHKWPNPDSISFIVSTW